MASVIAPDLSSKYTKASGTGYYFNTLIISSKGYSYS